MLKEQQKVEEAIALYRQASLQVENGFIYIELGNTLRDQNRLDEALVTYQKALRRDDSPMLLASLFELSAISHILAHYYLGETLQQQGKLQEAIGEYRQTLSLDPEFTIAQNRLATALQQLPLQ